MFWLFMPDKRLEYSSDRLETQNSTHVVPKKSQFFRLMYVSSVFPLCRHPSIPSDHDTKQSLSLSLNDMPVQWMPLLYQKTNNDKIIKLREVFIIRKRLIAFVFLIKVSFRNSPDRFCQAPPYGKFIAGLFLFSCICRNEMP